MQDKKQRSNDIKHQLLKQGLTLKAFSEYYGFKYRDVSDVVRGLRQGNFGAGRDITEKLNELGVI